MSHDPSAMGTEGEVPADGFDFQLYRYNPSLPAAIVSVAVFAILTALHCWRMHKARSFYFTAFIIGGVCAWIRSP